MPHPFSFQALTAANPISTEANIFVHGYSAGHSDEDKQALLNSIPEGLGHCINIFAFWPSNHYLRFDKSSLWAIGRGGLGLALGGASSAYLGLASSLANDRRANFTAARSRAESMGAVLLEQLSEYLLSHHPEVKTINLIGHSLGGRLVVSTLRNFTSRHQLAIKDVLLMAAAVEVSAIEARQMRGLLQGRLINAYSKADRTLLLNLDETCLGRNQVEHLDNFEMLDFGHTDYWERLQDVLTATRFAPPVLDMPAQLENAAEPAPIDPLPPAQPAEDLAMTLELSSPDDVYQRINDELALIIDELSTPSNDPALKQAQKDAHKQLSEHQAALLKRLAELERNAEWNTFTIALYGETGAGKSTLIETLRILLQEPGKQASQKAFRELRSKYAISEENLQRLQQSIAATEARLGELAEQLRATSERFEQPQRDAQNALDQATAQSTETTQRLGQALQEHEQQHKDALNAVTRLHTLLAERKSTASVWQTLLNLFRKMPEEIELAQATAALTTTTATRDSTAASLSVEQQKAEQERATLEQQLSEIITSRDQATAALSEQQSEVVHQQQAFAQQRLEVERESVQLLEELERVSDGEIIGDGRADFTRQTQRYDLKLDGKPFALLDVPGIEGKEGLVLSEIERAVQTAHAVFYVTNQPAPPQTGDGQRQGTLEKIKQHLGAQTEVWTVFNKKITNPKHALNGRPLTSDDENASLAGLDEKMREQLGKHYQEVFPLTALPAFLASTDHFAPGSQNDKRRSKVLADFGADELLKQSRVQAFLQLLGNKLIHNGDAKIIRANFNKANEALNHTTDTLSGIQKTLSALSQKLGEEEQSAKSQLGSSFQALKTRLESCGERLIDEFASSVRNGIYARIDDDISNDNFKQALEDLLETHQKRLSKKLPEAVNAEVGKFQAAAEDILARFEKHAQELTVSYGRLGSTRLNEHFNLNIKIDNGVKVAGLIGGLIGIALAPFTGGASLWVAGAAALSVLVSLAKAFWSALSSDYKKSQQREAAEKNVKSATEQLRDALRDSLKTALAEMQKTINQLDQALEAPAKQAAVQVVTLARSTLRLNKLSRQIETAGKL
jgi:energy-coupling factor transporter ATP-binding protein EcfA2